MHAIHFFCPGRPSDAVIARYEQALSPLDDARIIWHTPAGTSSVFTQLVRSWVTGPIDYLRSREPEGSVTRSLVAFSAGYGAIREIIRHTENRGPIDAIVLLDALHAGLDPDGTARDDQISSFAGYATRAKDANQGQLLWSAHTDVPTYGYASTTNSNEELVRLAHGEGGQFAVHSYDLQPASKAKAEHAGALVDWGPGYLAEALVPHLGALALRRETIPNSEKSEQVGEIGTPPWHNPDLPVSERAVLWSLAQRSLGGIETAGRNAGPIIASYFRHAKRRAEDGQERPLVLRSGEWCAVAACYAERQCRLEGDEMTLPYRVSAFEMQRDAREAKTWRPADLVRHELWTPMVGDLAVFVRPAYAEPNTTWKRHVGRLCEGVEDTFYRTIDANQGDRWLVVGRRTTDPDLLGFIERTPRKPEQTLEVLSPEVWAQVVQTSEDVMQGRSGLDYALEGLLPQDLVS